jgi:hypothetical protein
MEQKILVRSNLGWATSCGLWGAINYYMFRHFLSNKLVNISNVVMNLALLIEQKAAVMKYFLNYLNNCTRLFGQNFQKSFYAETNGT